MTTVDCEYYKEDSVYINGVKRKVCAYFDLDRRGICRHHNRNTCIIYTQKNITTNPIIEKLIEEFELTLVK